MMQNLQYYIETYGCQMNIYDSELVAGLLEKCGYHETKKISNADAIFLNTCAIREKAEETVHHKLDTLQHLKKKNPKIDLISFVFKSRESIVNLILLES